MEYTQEELRSMSEDEFWELINRGDPHPLSEEREPLHFNTKEEWLEYFSDGHEAHEFFELMRDKYGV